MQPLSLLQKIALGIVALGMIGAQKAIPSFTIAISHWTRTSAYEYRIITDHQRQFLEMRQEGKQKWAQVEDVTCTKTGTFESDSFDYIGDCK